MYLPDFLRGLLRRWYAVFAGLCLTAAVCAMAVSSLPRTYDAQGSLLLLPPKNSIDSKGNPYLYLGGLAQALDVLSARMNSDPVRRPLEEQHPAATYGIGPDRSTTGPIILVTSSGTSAAETMSMLEDALAATPRALTALQDELGIQETARITLMRLAVDEEPILDTKARMKVLLALVGAGVAGTVLGTALLDRFLRTRPPRRRRPRTAPQPQSPAASSEGTAPAYEEGSLPTAPQRSTREVRAPETVADPTSSARPVSERVGRR